MPVLSRASSSGSGISSSFTRYALAFTFPQIVTVSRAAPSSPPWFSMESSSRSCSSSFLIILSSVFLLSVSVFSAAEGCSVAVSVTFSSSTASPTEGPSSAGPSTPPDASVLSRLSDSSSSAVDSSDGFSLSGIPASVSSGLFSPADPASLSVVPGSASSFGSPSFSKSDSFSVGSDSLSVFPGPASASVISDSVSPNITRISESSFESSSLEFSFFETVSVPAATSGSPASDPPSSEIPAEIPTITVR